MRGGVLILIPADPAVRDGNRVRHGIKQDTVASTDFCCTTGLLAAFPHVTLRVKILPQALKPKPSNSKPKKHMFKRILIANRGEIACRVIKTARRMGIE